MASTKFYVCSISHVWNFADEPEPIKWVITNVLASDRIILLQKSDGFRGAFIPMTKLFLGDNKFPLIDLEKNVIVNRGEIDSDIYWIINEGFIRKNPDEIDFSLESIQRVTFLVENDTLYASLGCGHLIPVNLSDIVFCFTDQNNLVTYVPYPLKSSSNAIQERPFLFRGPFSRPVSLVLYIEPWHRDIEYILNLSAKDLHFRLVIDDIFIKRLKEDGIWSFMCPSECPGLSDKFGEEFTQIYESYEKQGKFLSQTKARNLWLKILQSQMETGTPLILSKYADSKQINSAPITEPVHSCWKIAQELITSYVVTNINVYDTFYQIVFDDPCVSRPILSANPNIDGILELINLSAKEIHHIHFHRKYINVFFKTNFSVLIQNIVFKLMTSYAINSIDTYDARYQILFTYPFVSSSKKPNSIIIDKIIGLIKSDARQFSLEVHATYIDIFFK